MFSEIVGRMWILVLVCLDFSNEEFLFSFVVSSYHGIPKTLLVNH